MTGCGCTLKRIGEDISEKLDYTPGLFTVERHIRGKWACAQCQTLVSFQKKVKDTLMRFVLGSYPQPASPVSRELVDQLLAWMTCRLFQARTVAGWPNYWTPYLQGWAK